MNTNQAAKIGALTSFGAINCILFSALLLAPVSAQSVKVQTDWGFVSVNQVKAPKKGKCVKVSVAVDIRNPNITPPFIGVAIVDNFSNVYGYSETYTFRDDRESIWDPLVKVKPGVYRSAMSICAKKHFYVDPEDPDQEKVDLVTYNPRGKYSLGLCEGSALADSSTCESVRSYRFT